MSPVLQGGLTATEPLQLTAQLLGLGFASATAAGLAALCYRWYVRERVPTGLGILFGLTVVAVYLGTTGALGGVIDPSTGQDAVLQSGNILKNLAGFAVGAAGSAVGIRAGDAVGTDLFATTSRTVNTDVSDVVQTVGRVTSVRLPADIDDIVGYDPVPEKTKETLADRRFLFPRRLTGNELRNRLVARLKTDYGVGHVDLELGEVGAVEYLAVGSRAAGIGPTLPPATNAVAIRADPANAASSGDLVQVWQREPLERVLTGELRGVADDVVTVAIDASDTPKLDPTTEYKLVTLPVQDRPDREFASLLRAADETMTTITVPPDNELVGTTVGELDVTVAAITREDGAPEPIPSRNRVLAAGDVIYAIAKPDALRSVEIAANRQHEPDPMPEMDTADDTAPEPAEDSGDGTSNAEPETEDELVGEAEPPSAPADEATAPDSDKRSRPEPEPSDAAESDRAESRAEKAAPVTGDQQADGDPDTGTADDETIPVWDPEEKLADDLDETPASDRDDPLKNGPDAEAGVDATDADTDDRPSGTDDDADEGSGEFDDAADEAPADDDEDDTGPTDDERPRE